MTDHAQEARDIFHDWNTNRAVPADAYEVLMAGWLAAQVAVEARLGQIADALTRPAADEITPQVVVAALREGERRGGVVSTTFKVSPDNPARNVVSPAGEPITATVTITPEPRRCRMRPANAPGAGITCGLTTGHDGPHSWEPKP